MAKITIDEIKKVMETERDLTVVLDSNNRALKKNCDFLEKHLKFVEKHFEAMEKTAQLSEKNAETLKLHTQMLEKHIAATENNTNVLQKLLQVIEVHESRRSDRIRLPSDSSDLMTFSPSSPPPPPPPEPANKKSKYENSYNPNGSWYPPLPNNNPPQVFYQNGPFNGVAPFENPLRAFFPHNQMQNNHPQFQSFPQNRRPTRFDVENTAPAFSSGKKVCIFCSDNNHNHISEWCPVLRDYEARTKFLNLHSFCLTCAEPRQNCRDAKTCRHASRRCIYCPMKHWHALCPKKYPPNVPFNF